MKLPSVLTFLCYNNMYHYSKSYVALSISSSVDTGRVTKFSASSDSYLDYFIVIFNTMSAFHLVFYFCCILQAMVQLR